MPVNFLVNVTKISHRNNLRGERIISGPRFQGISVHQGKEDMMKFLYWVFSWDGAPWIVANCDAESGLPCSLLIPAPSDNLPPARPHHVPKQCHVWRPGIQMYLCMDQGAGMPDVIHADDTKNNESGNTWSIRGLYMLFTSSKSVTVTFEKVGGCFCTLSNRCPLTQIPRGYTQQKSSVAVELQCPWPAAGDAFVED